MTDKTKVRETAEFKEALGLLREFFQEVTERLKGTAERVVELLKKEPRIEEELMSEIPYLDECFFSTLRGIAAGRLIPEAISALIHGKAYLTRKLRSLPPEMQRELFVEEKPIKVVISGGESLLIPMKNMQYDQVKQVFDGDVVRSEAKQRAWIEDKKTQEVRRKASRGTLTFLGWSEKNGKYIFETDQGDLVISRHTAQEIAADLLRHKK